MTPTHGWTAERRAEIEKLLEKATPGPWRSGPHYRHDIESAHGRVGTVGNMGAPQAIANAAFIAAARTALPDALAEIDRLTAEQEWQEIATAPKDGTPVLLYYPNRYEGNGGVTWGCFLNGGWTDSRVIDDNDCTHWQPLPPPPARLERPHD